MKKILRIAKQDHFNSWRERSFILLFVIGLGLIGIALYLLNKIPKFLIIAIAGLVHRVKGIPLAEAESVLFFTIISYVLIFVFIFCSSIMASSIFPWNSSRFVFSKIGRKDYLLALYLSRIMFISILSITSFLLVSLYLIDHSFVSWPLIGSFILFFIIFGGVWLSIFMLISSMVKSQVFVFLYSGALIFLLAIVKFSSAKIISPFTYIPTSSVADILLNSLYLLPFMIVPLFLACLRSEVIDV